MTILRDILDNSLFSGVPSNAVYDLLKGAWQKANEKSWNDLYLDSLQEAFEQLRPSLAKYANDGEVTLDRAELSEALTQDLAISLNELSLTRLSNEEFASQFARAMQARFALVIGGYNLNVEDYTQLVRNLLYLTESKFKTAILSNEAAFRRAVLEEAKTNQDLVRDLNVYLAERFDWVQDEFASVRKQIDAQKIQGVFVSQAEFVARLERRSRKLPFSIELVGRETDLAKALEFINAGTRILVVDGDPGIGKTRFSISLAENLSSLARFNSHDIRCLIEPPPNLWEAMQSELQTGQKYIVIADDANRIEHLSLLRNIFTDSRWAGDSVLITTTRSYNRELVVDELRQSDLAGVESLTLKRLSNADIDTILSAKPFELDRELRKRVIAIAHGNPRMTAIAAEALKNGVNISEGSFPNLFKTYFDGVFNELNTFFNSNLKDKTLLAVIAALRFVRMNDDDLKDFLWRRIGYADEREFNYSISRLQASEVLDVLLSNQVVRVFDDSISEYLVFRYFFDDTTGYLNFEREILEPFKTAYSSRVFEVLVALIQKGYQSKRLTDVILRLPHSAQRILQNTADDETKTQVLEQMKLYGQSSPILCFEVIEEYIRRRSIQAMPANQASIIVDTVFQVMFKDWRRLLIPVVNLLRDFSVENVDSRKEIAKKARENLVKIFDYHAYPTVGNRIQFFYEPYKILVSELDQWVHHAEDETACELYVDLLGHLCAHHVMHDEVDYVDQNKIHMAAWPLVLNDYLKQIRTKTYSLLSELYSHPSITPQIKLKVLRAYQSSFPRILPFGDSPSQELMKSDAESLVPICSSIAGGEMHFALKDNLRRLLRDVEEQLEDGRAKLIAAQMETVDFEIYRKFSGSYWDEERLKSHLNQQKLDRNWEEEKRKQSEFLNDFPAQFGIDRIDELALLLTKIHLDGTLQNSDLWLMRQFLDNLAFTRAEISVSLLELISDSSHPLFQYSAGLIANLAAGNSSTRTRIAKEWIVSGDILKLRTIAQCYAYRVKSEDIADLEILEQLMAVRDDLIDWSLTRAFLCVESIDSQRVACNLLTLAQRISAQAFSELLMALAPDERFPAQHYHTHVRHPDLFCNIVMESARLGDFNHVSFTYHLSNALRALTRDSLDSVMIYLEKRYVFFLNKQTESRFYYNAFPDSVDLTFAITQSDYRAFLQQLLEKFKDARPHNRLFWMDVLKTMLIPVNVRHEEQYVESDSVTRSVFVEWLNGDRSQAETILFIFEEIHPWQLWFDSMRQIVKRRDIPQNWDHLMRVLYLGAHSGPTSVFYTGRLEMIRSQKRKDDSPEMQRFLEYLEQRFGEMIGREKERENDEDLFHQEFR